MIILNPKSPNGCWHRSHWYPFPTSSCNSRAVGSLWLGQHGVNSAGLIKRVCNSVTPKQKILVNIKNTWFNVDILAHIVAKTCCRSSLFASWKKNSVASLNASPVRTTYPLLETMSRMVRHLGFKQRRCFDSDRLHHITPCHQRVRSPDPSGWRPLAVTREKSRLETRP